MTALVMDGQMLDDLRSLSKPLENGAGGTSGRSPCPPWMLDWDEEEEALC